MKKLLYVFLALIIAGSGYYFIAIDKDNLDSNLSNQMGIYRDTDIGLQFDYRVGPTGYVVDERIPADLDDDLVRVIILQRNEDVAKQMPIGGEGPAVISISVFKNSNKQFARVWADNHIPYSNINLVSGTVSDTVVGGANAIRYMADGLYASENIIVAHGDSVYVVTGQFMTEDSDLRRDFNPLVQSINFIPKT